MSPHNCILEQECSTYYGLFKDFEIQLDFKVFTLPPESYLIDNPDGSGGCMVAIDMMH